LLLPDLVATDADWEALVGRCDGNAHALKVMGNVVRGVSGGDIAEFPRDVLSGTIVFAKYEDDSLSYY
jgi:hypothetical protein